MRLGRVRSSALMLAALLEPCATAGAALLHCVSSGCSAAAAWPQERCMVL